MKYLTTEPSPFVGATPRRALIDTDDFDDVILYEEVKDFETPSRIGKFAAASALSVVAIAGGFFATSAALATNHDVVNAVPAVVDSDDDYASTIVLEAPSQKSLDEASISRSGKRTPVLVAPTTDSSKKASKTVDSSSVKSTKEPVSSKSVTAPAKSPVKIAKVVKTSDKKAAGGSRDGSSAAVGNGRLAHPLPGSRMTSKFGPRMHPVLHVPRFHTGVDFASGCGPSVRAAGDGVVTSVGWNTAYGNRVVVKHTNDVSTTYNHLSETSVSVGQTVSTGDEIGKEGTTGWSTGCHLHFEVVYKGSYVDPMPWLDGRGGDHRGVAAGDLTNLKPVRTGNDAKTSVKDTSGADVPLEKARPVEVKEHSFPVSTSSPSAGATPNTSTGVQPTVTPTFTKTPVVKESPRVVKPTPSENPTVSPGTPAATHSVVPTPTASTTPWNPVSTATPSNTASPVPTPVSTRSTDQKINVQKTVVQKTQNVASTTAAPPQSTASFVPTTSTTQSTVSPVNSFEKQV